MIGKSSEGQAGDQSDRPGNEGGKRDEEWTEGKKKKKGEYLRRGEEESQRSGQSPLRRI